MRTLFFITFLLASCSGVKKTGGNTRLENGSDSILFLVLKIRKDPGESRNSVELLGKTVGTGKIKREESRPYPSVQYLTIDIYRKNRIIHTQIMEHPLYKHIEHADEHGALHSKNIELEEAEFFIRLQVQGDAVQISETTGAGRSKTALTRIKL